ncbi:MAG: XdhC family protein [Rhodothermales bacterium]
MYEVKQILHHARRLRDAGQPCALATVVKIGGSTYRRPGARMLVDRDGATWGTISGGCLEGEVAERALEQMKTGVAETHPFELGEDDIILGFGTGCNGIVHVLIEPFAAGEAVTPLDWIGDAFASRRPAVMATVLVATGAWENQVARHALFAGDEPMQTSAPLPPDLLNAIRQDARALLDDHSVPDHKQTWQNRVYETATASADVLFETVQPPIRLFVFGEGHDIAPIVRITRSLGWETWIVGRKPEAELARKIPDADRHVFLMHPEEVASRITPDARTAAFVMNHSYLRDRALLAGLIETPIRYIGLLGPRSRTERMFVELAPLSEEVETRIYGPLGLDIGTETPEEIALAAIAEAQAAFHGRAGGMLRDRTAAIHS